MIISLIGFMGCGKSSVGRRLSELLCCRFVDLDEVVEEVAGKRVGEIFAVEGEVAFRDLESLSLNNILSKESARQWAPLAPSHFVGPSPYAGVRKCQFRQNASPISGIEPISKTSFQPTSNTAVGTAEDSAAETVAEETAVVLALGGGTVVNPECAEMVKENTLCIYLRASVSTLVERLASETESRPLLCQNTSSSMPAEGAKLSDHQLRNRIEVLLAQRAATYENTAHIIIDTDGKSIDEICSEIRQ